MMRELVLSQIKQGINDGDDEIVVMFGEFKDIALLSDEELLKAYVFMVSERI